MIQLAILTGGKAGCHCLARRFPFLVGRAADASLSLADDGVWDRHAEIQFRPGEGFFLQTQPGALVSINGGRADQARLRNGDLLELGSVKIRFWLAPALPSSLWPREALTWVALAALFAFQLGLIYLLLG